MSYADFFRDRLEQLYEGRDSIKDQFLSSLWNTFIEFHEKDRASFTATLYFHQREMTLLASRNATREDFAWALEMLETGDPAVVEYHYDRLMQETKNEDFVRVQLVMALMAEIAENKTDQINNERFDFYLKQLPVKYTTDFKSA